MILGLSILLIILGALLQSGLLHKAREETRPEYTDSGDLILDGLCASLRKDADYPSTSRWQTARTTIDTLISRYGINNPTVQAQLRWSLENDDSIVAEYISKKLQGTR